MLLQSTALNNATVPAHHTKTTFGAKRYQNPWEPLSTITQSALSFLRLPFSRAIPFEGHFEPVKTVPFDASALDAGDDGAIATTWLGHAGFLVQFPRQKSEEKLVRILFDPMFSNRASPVTWFGPQRRIPPPCAVEELPAVDFIVISHNHYDHLDLLTLRTIWQNQQCTKEQPHLQFFVPLGVKPLLEEADIPSTCIHELDWWEEHSSTIAASPSLKIRIVCVPAQHNSGRSATDQFTTLWAGWVVEQLMIDASDDATHSYGRSASVYFAGDTGYQTANGPCPAFKEIGEKHGPFDLALIPIWRGASLSFLGKMGLRLADDTPLVTLHATPEDAVSLFKDVRACRAIAMHFGTFVGSDIEAVEPIGRLIQAAASIQSDSKYRPQLDEKDTGKYAWSKEGGFGWLDVGETAWIPSDCTE